MPHYRTWAFGVAPRVDWCLRFYFFPMISSVNNLLLLSYPVFPISLLHRKKNEKSISDIVGLGDIFTFIAPRLPVTKLSEINLCDLPSPLEIRVLRKWVPYVGKNERKQEVCYLFVDTNGYAIEAVADITKEKHFTSLINIGSTYTVDKYIAIPSRAYMPVVSHRTSLRMGNHTTFVPLLKESLPMYYYAFATYEDLPTRMELPKLLTDYIGQIQNISPPTIRAT
ncbi:hypothetical protein R6Q59_032575 [Mikania micrantha]